MIVQGATDEPQLKRMFGLQCFEKAMRIVEEGHVSDFRVISPRTYMVSIGEGENVYDVLKREHADGNILFDCDCGENACAHIVAAMILHNNLISCQEDDDEVIEDIRERIESLPQDILDDCDYDNDANYYDDWEIDKYGLCNDNDLVEYDHTHGILEDILCEINNPDTAAILIDGLISSANELECDNGGFERAFNEKKMDICNIFSRIGPKTVAEILKNRCYLADQLYKEYLKNTPRSSIYGSYCIVKQAGPIGRVGQTMLFENGDYDGFISASGNSVESIIKVTKSLERENPERASAYASRLIGHHDYYDQRKVADVLSKNGYGNEAAEIYRDLFVKNPYAELIDLISENTDKIDTRKLLKDLVEETVSKNEFSTTALICLVSKGHADEMDKYVRKIGFKPVGSWGHANCEQMQLLCELLRKEGYAESAAILGRGLIEYRLESRNANQYHDAADMLRYMDGESDYEKLQLKHSEYKEKLKHDYCRFNKFWSLYKNPDGRRISLR